VLAWSGGAAFFATLFTLGCFGVHGEQSIAQRYTKPEDIQPATLAYDKAYVIFAGNPVATTVSSSVEGGQTVFTFEGEGSVIDVEKYSSDESSFRFVGTETETYSPGITILRFPFEVGEEWTWGGKYKLSPEEREATAKVKTAEERLNTVAGEFMTVRVTVDLSIESGTAKPVNQKLTFWFAPKRGIVRREFQYSTTREPMPPSEDK
jgi:hypothetical protein